jgi:hypothetical protein
MKTSSLLLRVFCATALLVASSSTVQAQLLWTVGIDDEGWPAGDGGGPNASFVQENGSIQPLPGSPTSPEVNQQADNDYYFAGEYSTIASSIINYYGPYTPVGVVPVNEEAAERAFAGGDLDLRYHFNLPATLLPTDLLSVTFDANNLDTGGQSDPRFGIEIYFNGVLVQPQIIIRPPQLNVDYTTPQFTLASVNAQVGPGADNIVSLKGINYSTDGGGSWMGIDYVQLNNPTQVIPPPVFPLAVGLDDNSHPVGDGGGPNATFVQENGVINPLPGVPNSPEVDRQADNDYYFAGDFTTTIPSVVASYGAYTPVGLVSANEEAAERAFAAADNDLRYHFNLPNTLAPGDRVAISFDALSLDDTGTDPRYGVEVYFNGVLVQPQIVVRPGQLHQTITTPSFTLGSVNAAVGSGFDNIISLKGINYNSDGGGNWMGIDYVQVNLSTNTVPPPVLPWSVGLNDNAWPSGDGGGTNATFAMENGFSNPLPGTPLSEEFDGDPDDDYYFAGIYTSVIPGNGTYTPVGAVYFNEEGVARGMSGGDNDLRYHFNLPTTLTPDGLLSVTFDALALDTSGSDPRYGVEIYFNGILVQPEVLVRPAQLGQAIATARFSAASVNAQTGPGFDNILWLKGINYSASGGGDSIGFDYIQLNVSPSPTFPWAVGRDDEDWPAGNGGGPNTSFVQENGVINALPGRPNNPEVNQQNDNDYYFAGEYTAPISSVVARYGNYTPVGLVLANEEGAERAFAAADNDLRYHFNLPSSLQPNDRLAVTFDALNLHMENPDPRYGIEVYFNGVLVQTQIVIRPAQLGIDYTTPSFTLASVNAQTGLGADNIVSLRGINYNGEGGGNWMGIDYVQLNRGQVPTLGPKVVRCFSSCESNIIHVVYDKPVQLDGSYSSDVTFVIGVSYGASQSEVLVEIEPLPVDSSTVLTIQDVHDQESPANVIEPNPTLCTVHYGFGRFCTDFNDGQLPPGTVSSGTTPPAVGPDPSGIIPGVFLHMTELGVGGNQNHWTVPLAAPITIDRLKASWKTLLNGLGQADGFSFNVGEGPFTYVAGVEEEGATNGLSVCIDTFHNGDIEATDIGLEINWNGARIGFTQVAGAGEHGPPALMRNVFVDASVEVTPSGAVTFIYDNFVATGQIPGFSGITVNQYEFGARTGGAAEACWIDDVCINNFSLTGPTLVGPTDQTVTESSTATFRVTVDGIPPFSYQWLRDGVPIPGATSATYSFSAARADDGHQYSVRVANDCGSVTSQTATLTVIIAPVAQNCTSRGNCHAIYITYNKPVLLDGTYSVACSNTIPAVGVSLFSQDFNAGDGGFTVDTPIAYDGPWIYDAALGLWRQDGQEGENQHPNTSTLISPAINVTQSGVVRLTFAHGHSFEGGRWDGGQVRVSVNGGAFSPVPASAFSQNGYNGTVLPNSQSILKGLAAYVENSLNYPAANITSTCTLGFYQAGDSIRVAFIAASDTNTRGQFVPNWQIDSLQISVADPAVTPITVTGVTYGESSNIVCLAVSPDLSPDTNVYYVTIRDVHDTEGVVVNPNPSLCSFVHGAEFPPFRILYKRFDNILGALPPALYADPDYPNNPNVIQRDPTGFFEMPSNVGDNYGAQMLGFPVAPVAGNYRFWVSADDGADVFLATDAVPANKVRIAFEPAWGEVRRYADCLRSDGTVARTCGPGNVPVENQSAPIYLNAGQRVYLEGDLKEAAGGDNFAVAVTIDDPNPPANGSSPIPISAFAPMRVGPGGIVFSRLCEVFCNVPPADQTVFIGQSATFSFAPDGTPPYIIQWQKNGVSIPGATGLSYTTPPATATDNGAVFSVLLANSFSSTNCSGVLHVRPEPRVVQCFARCEDNRVHVVYNKPVALNGTYILDGGFVSVQSVAYGASQSEVIVTTDPLVPDDPMYPVHTLEISDVTDLLSPPNAIIPNPTTCTFVYGFNRFCVDFNDGQLPPGTIASGTTPPYVGPEGALHLTDLVGSQANYWTIPLASVQTLPIFSAQWRTLIQNVGGADGMSFTVGVNPNIPTPEEGGDNGLSVSVDTFNNGAADAGLEIKYNGTRIGFLPVGAGTDGSGAPPELARGEFVDTSVDVTTSGAVTFKYHTYAVTAQIPNYQGINVNRYVFAARTGGAFENAWIDDVCINPWTPGLPSIVQQPADATIARECFDSATFHIRIDGTPPYDVQWLSNGVVVASVNGSVSPTHSYTTPILDRSADGARYKAVVASACGVGMTREAVVTIVRDESPPVLLSALSPGDCANPQYTAVLLTFNEPLDAATANNPANYIVNNGSIGVSSARLLTGGGFAQTVMGALPANGRTVELTLSSALPRVACNYVEARNLLDFCTFNTGGGRVPIELRTPIQGSGPQNLIVVEAENFDFNRSPGTTNVGGAQGRLNENFWVTDTALPGFLGTGYVDAIPNLTSFGGNLPTEPAFFASPRLDYCVNVPVSGTYYIWVRGSSGNDGGNNSLHMAVDGVSVDGRGRNIGNATPNWGADAANVNAFGWVNNAATSPAAIDLTAGVHSINILMREDGLRIDRFVLTTDAAFTLAPADLGPPASSRQPLVDEPPVVSCSNVVAECTGGLTPVTYTVRAFDNCDGPVPVTCVPPSGTGFRVGTSNVICTARDSAGNTSSCSFTVTVVDTIPPQVNCPANITAPATSSSGAVVTYVAGASDACGILSFVCSPPSGSTFPVGVTTVVCTAIDLAGHSSTCSFTISVLEANRPPTCVLQLACPLTFAGDPNTYVIALDDSRACVILDGSGSSDPEGDPLTYAWNFGFTTSLDPSQEVGGGGTGSGSGTVALQGNSLSINVTFSGLTAAATAMHIHGPAAPGDSAGVLYSLQSIGTLGATAGTINGTVTLVNGTAGLSLAQQLQQLHAGLWYINIHSAFRPAGEIRGQIQPIVLTGPVVTNCLALGCHSVVLSVSDGRSVSRCETNLCVISGCDAVEQCIVLVDGTAIARRSKRPLIASLKAACVSFEQGDFVSGLNQLESFQKKVNAQVATAYPAEAAALIECAQQIIDAITCAATLDERRAQGP